MIICRGEQAASENSTAAAAAKERKRSERNRYGFKEGTNTAVTVMTIKIRSAIAPGTSSNNRHYV
jgi:hypothetical protein